MMNQLSKVYLMLFMIWVASVAFSEEDKSTKVIQTEPQYAEELLSLIHI